VNRNAAFKDIHQSNLSSFPSRYVQSQTTKKYRRDTYQYLGYTKKTLEFLCFHGGDYLNCCVLVSDPTDVSEKTAPSIFSVEDYSEK